MREEVELLEKKPVPPPPGQEPRRVVPQGNFIDLQGPRGGFIQSAAEPQKSAFSPAGWPNQHQHPGLHRQGQAIQGIEGAVSADEGIGVQLHVRKSQPAVAALKRRSSQWAKAAMGSVNNKYPA